MESSVSRRSTQGEGVFTCCRLLTDARSEEQFLSHCLTPNSPAKAFRPRLDNEPTFHKMGKCRTIEAIGLWMLYNLFHPFCCMICITPGSSFLTANHKRFLVWRSRIYTRGINSPEHLRAKMTALTSAALSFENPTQIHGEARLNYGLDCS